MKYAGDVFVTTMQAFLQRFGVFYDPKFDVTQHKGSEIYEPKLDFESPSTVAVATVKPGERVADLGCGTGALAERLRDRGVDVVGVDGRAQDESRFDRFVKADLDTGDLPVDPGEFDTILLLDGAEHLSAPEQFMGRLREAIWAKDGPGPKIIASTGNVAFLIPVGDPDTRPVQLRATWHPGHDAPPALHGPVVQAALPAGGLRHREFHRHPAAPPDGRRKGCSGAHGVPGRVHTRSPLPVAFRLPIRCDRPRPAVTAVTGSRRRGRGHQDARDATQVQAAALTAPRHARAGWEQKCGRDPLRPASA